MTLRMVAAGRPKLCFATERELTGSGIQDVREDDVLQDLAIPRAQAPLVSDLLAWRARPWRPSGGDR